MDVLAIALVYARGPEALGPLAGGGARRAEVSPFVGTTGTSVGAERYTRRGERLVAGYNGVH